MGEGASVGVDCGDRGGRASLQQWTAVDSALSCSVGWLNPSIPFQLAVGRANDSVPGLVVGCAPPSALPVGNGAALDPTWP
jgi:hypothetical protein